MGLILIQLLLSLTVLYIYQQKKVFLKKMLLIDINNCLTNIGLADQKIPIRNKSVTIMLFS